MACMKYRGCNDLIRGGTFFYFDGWLLGSLILCRSFFRSFVRSFGSHAEEFNFHGFKLLVEKCFLMIFPVPEADEIW